MTFVLSRRAPSLLIMALLAASGCSGQDGPERYRVYGAATHAGRPIPIGFVTFIPDTAKGNRGPGGGGTIKDGHYDTSSGKGMVGGPHIVQVIGFDGVPAVINGERFEEGTPLFQTYEFQADLPKEAGTYDIDVPISKRSNR